MPGVKVVREGDFVGVAAPDPQTAEKALAALKARMEADAGRGIQPRRLRVLQEDGAGPARPRAEA